MKPRVTHDGGSMWFVMVGSRVAGHFREWKWAMVRAFRYARGDFLPSEAWVEELISK
jgi:hypothetical protein